MSYWRTICLLPLICAAMLAGVPPRAHTATASVAAPAVTAAGADPGPRSAAVYASAPDDDDDDDLADVDQAHAGRRHRQGHDLVNLGRDTDLPAGERADAVVSIAGSASAEGDARTVVSILGDAKATGSVSDSAVAVLGNTFIDGRIGGDVVSVLGNVELGPRADVRGNVVAVGGHVDRAPSSQVRGAVQSLGAGLSGFDGLRSWIRHCLLYGRPLAVAPGLGWAWQAALGLLLLYAGIAVLFREGVSHCERILGESPGMAFLAALVTALATPLLLVLLCVTFVGFAAVPFVLAALLAAGLFGKVVVLAWLGHRILGARGEARGVHPAVAVVLAGAMVLLLYLVPVLGFVAYKVLGLFGLGAVVLALVRLTRASRVGENPVVTPTPPGVPPTPPMPRPASNAEPDFAAIPSEAAATATPAPPPGTGLPPGAAPPPGAGPPPAAGLPRAGFWVRMAALLLDCVLVGFVIGVLRHGWHLQPLLLAAYGAVLWKVRGATVGGIVFDLQVVRLDGRAMDWQTSIVRALSCFLSLAVAGLGFFWIAFDPGRQAWHDKIAATAVVRVRAAVALPG